MIHIALNPYSDLHDDGPLQLRTAAQLLGCCWSRRYANGEVNEKAYGIRSVAYTDHDRKLIIGLGQPGKIYIQI